MSNLLLFLWVISIGLISCSSYQDLNNNTCRGHVRQFQELLKNEVLPQDSLDDSSYCLMSPVEDEIFSFIKERSHCIEGNSFKSFDKYIIGNINSYGDPSERKNSIVIHQCYADSVRHGIFSVTFITNTQNKIDSVYYKRWVDGRGPPPAYMRD